MLTYCTFNDVDSKDASSKDANSGSHRRQFWHRPRSRADYYQAGTSRTSHALAERNKQAVTAERQGYRVVAVVVDMGTPITELGCETPKLDVSSEHDINCCLQRNFGQPSERSFTPCRGRNVSARLGHTGKGHFTKLQKTFAANTFGPLLLTPALLPSIELAERLGSIGDNLQVACTPTAVRRLRRICSSATSVSI